MSRPVYLVRHGQSQWNLARLTQGQTPHPRLTDLGRRQAAAAARTIASDVSRLGLRVERVVTSDLTRAMETADVVAVCFGVTLTCDVRLREQHLGALQGRRYEEAWAVAGATDWSDPTQPVCGGESPMDVYHRMRAVLDGLDRSAVTVLVSHGDAIRAAVAHLDGVTPDQTRWLDVPNGAVARVGDDVTWLGQ